MNVQSALENTIYDICIIGGGAAGLAAGIKAKQLDKEASVLVVEKNDSLGRKIKATGNGRCNITNINAEDYIRVTQFFSSIGIITRTYANGLVYPYSESASDVTKILSDTLISLNAQYICNAEVVEIRRPDSLAGFFEIKISFCKDNRKSKASVIKRIKAGNVIVATGGKASPAFGSTGDGYRFAGELGHEVVKTIPILAGVECEGKEIQNLAGIRAKAKISLLKHKEKIFEEYGEIQFTKYGLSGICIFNMTRFMRLGKGESFSDFEVNVDLCPGLRIDEFIFKRAEEGVKARDILTTLVKPALSSYIVKLAGIENGEECVDDVRAAKIVDLLHNLKFLPFNVRKWQEAQCTSGGVKLSELSEFYESKLIKGLFFAGEVVDYDGPCGGYNLTNAWSTGISAAEGAITNLKENIV